MSQWLRKERLAEPILLDFHDFPLRTHLTFTDTARMVLELSTGDRVEEEEIAGVWWRRPQRFSFAETLTGSVERFCELNCAHAMRGFFEILGERVVESPSRLEAASLKMARLRLAQHCGLAIPPTCITNDPGTARRFIESQPTSVVYKILQGNEVHYTGTRVLQPSDLENLPLLRHAPVVFQRFIEPGFDVRVTIVGHEVFAAKLYSDRPEALADIRNDTVCQITPYELPSDFEERLRRLTAFFQLRFAAIDVRVDKNGKHHFLELNPAGQYLFVETATNLPITAALAKLLVGGARISERVRGLYEQ